MRRGVKLSEALNGDLLRSGRWQRPRLDRSAKIVHRLALPAREAVVSELGVAYTARKEVLVRSAREVARSVWVSISWIGVWLLMGLAITMWATQSALSSAEHIQISTGVGVAALGLATCISSLDRRSMVVGLAPTFGTGLSAVLVAVVASSDNALVAGTTLVACVALGYGLDRRRSSFASRAFDAARVLVGLSVGLVVLRAGSGAGAVVIASGVVTLVLGFSVAPLLVRSQRANPGAQSLRDLLFGMPRFFFMVALGFSTASLFLIAPIAFGLVCLNLAVARAVGSAGSGELLVAQRDAVRVLVGAIETKDPYTAGHSARVAQLSRTLGKRIGLTDLELEHLEYAAILHDVGKLAVPSELLNKPGRLTEEEFSVVQRHNQVCGEILGQIDFLSSVIPAASDHFGRYRGSERLSKHALEGHIIAVADAFDAMTSTRAYRKALSQEVAVEELQSKAGSQFNPLCVDAMLAYLQESGVRYGAGHEALVFDFGVEPPAAGLGSAGLGDLAIA